MSADRFVAHVRQQLTLLFPELSASAVQSEPNKGRLVLDSRQVSSGDFFVALNGSVTQGADFIPQAKAQGAVLVLLESDQDHLYWIDSLPVVALNHLRARLGNWLAEAGGLNDPSLHLIGVTGTNGKTSVSHYLAQMFDGLNRKAAVIGTVGIGALGQLQTATHTTPDLISLHRVMADLKDQGFSCQAMEVSSHALDQLRTAGVPFQVGVFTNLSRDHLDYHGTMAAYGAAKTRLFTEYPLQVAVINIDDAYGQTLAEQVSGLGKLTLCRYSLHQTVAELYCERITANAAGFELVLAGRWGRFELQLPLLGTFNIANALAAAGVLLSLGFEPTAVMAQLQALRPVAGRMQRVSSAGAESAGVRLPQVVVDYAHTPDALENALLAVREHIQGRLWCVFGCGGDRDAGKRPLMAEVASRLADDVVVTSDNPRTEDPAHILEQVEQGLTRPPRFSLVDREAAIRQSILAAAADDVILIAGKGHETYQEVMGVRHHFDDVEQAEKNLVLRAVDKGETI